MIALKDWLRKTAQLSFYQCPDFINSKKIKKILEILGSTVCLHKDFLILLFKTKEMMKNKLSDEWNKIFLDEWNSMYDAGNMKDIQK